MNERISIMDQRPKVKSQNRLPQIQRKKNHSKTKNSPVDRILFLQRTAGNQAVQRLIKSGDLQAKLRIGQPGNIYEQEADRVAEQVMRMPEPQAISSGTPYIHSIQRACIRSEDEVLSRQPIEEEKEKEDELRRQPIEEEEEELQAKATSDGISEVNPDIESHIQNMRGGGQPLPESARAYFEPRFGQDFSQVRVHSDAEAAESAREVNARAFTVGQDVVFGGGQYAPEIMEGQRLLAHELTHVVQQSGTQRHNNLLHIKDKKTDVFQFYQTPIATMIQFQLFRDCTPQITGAAMTQNAIDNLILGARMAGELLVNFAESAVRSIRGGTASAAVEAAFANHFGAPTRAQINTILNRFTDISRRLSSNRLFICNTARSAFCRRGWCAYANCPGSRGTLTHICTPFFQTPYPCGARRHDLAMIHEAAHAADACNDVNPDAGYPPANAQNNAPSYSEFADQVFLL